MCVCVISTHLVNIVKVTDNDSFMEGSRNDLYRMGLINSSMLYGEDKNHVKSTPCIRVNYLEKVARCITLIKHFRLHHGPLAANKCSCY